MADPSLLRRGVGFVRRNVHVGRPPLRDRTSRWSVISPVASADDALIGLALRAADRAQQLDLASIAQRAQRPDETRWVNQWPGEHYRFLAALVEVLEPRSIVEIGTYTGLSSLAMLSTMPPDARLATFDIIPWDAIDRSSLRADDFGDRFAQHLGDLSDPSTFALHRELLTTADLIFIDGPKDRKFEPALLSMLLPVLTGSTAVLVLDDIRVMEMVAVWDAIKAPKFDATSLAHWSGTGLVRLP